ncbi:MAG: hypothetical protein J7494_05540 [Sphingobium sp.]|nr:hypothetical protein [Sphingobium sp.]
MKTSALRLTGRLAPLLAALAAPAAADRIDGLSDPRSWTIDKQSRQCTLGRAITTPEPMTLAISSIVGSDEYSLVLGVAKLPAHDDKPVPVRIQLDGTKTVIKGTVRFGKLSGSAGEALNLSAIRGADLSAIGRASALRLIYKGKTIGPLPLPEAAKAVAALKACLAEHLVALGADPAQFKPGGGLPVQFRSYARGTVINTDALRSAGLKFGVDSYYAMTIGERGAIESCRQLGDVQPERVEKLVCQALVGKIFFRPARDPAGKPVKGVATYPLRVQLFFVMPNGPTTG